MDCGDRATFFFPVHVARTWPNTNAGDRFLHDIGTFELKHGVPVSVSISTRMRLECESGRQSSKPSGNVAPMCAGGDWRCTHCAGAQLLPASYSFARGPTTSALRVLDKSIAVLRLKTEVRQSQCLLHRRCAGRILTGPGKDWLISKLSAAPSVLQYKSGVARNLREIAQPHWESRNVVEGKRFSDWEIACASTRQLIDARNECASVGPNLRSRSGRCVSPSKARSPRRLPISCRPSSR